MLGDNRFRCLDSILAAWSASSALAVVLAACRLQRLQISGWRKNIDWQWIVKGLKVSVSFLFATLALRGVFTIDRYWFKAINDLEIVGAYVFFFVISSTLLAFLESTYAAAADGANWDRASLERAGFGPDA